MIYKDSCKKMMNKIYLIKFFKKKILDNLVYEFKKND